MPPPPLPTHSITFRMRPEDLETRIRNQYWRGRDRIGLGCAITTALCGVATISVFLLSRGDTQSTPFAIGVLLFIVTGVLGLTIPRLKRDAMDQWRKSGCFDHDASIDVSAAGIRRRDHTGDGTTAWRCFEEIEECEDALLLVYREEFGGDSLMIPGHAFADAEARSSFLEFVRAQIRNESASTLKGV